MYQDAALEATAANAKLAAAMQAVETATESQKEGVAAADAAEEAFRRVLDSTGIERNQAKELLAVPVEDAEALRQTLVELDHAVIWTGPSCFNFESLQYQARSGRSAISIGRAGLRRCECC
jgi:hypothetical protein